MKSKIWGYFYNEYFNKSLDLLLFKTEEKFDLLAKIDLKKILKLKKSLD